jgi:hypothetical protein
LLVTDIHESDDTLQAVALTAKLTAPTVLPEAKIDDDNDLGNNLDTDLKHQESVRVYEKHVKANWRLIGWNIEKHEDVLCDMSWAGLCNSLKNNDGTSRLLATIVTYWMNTLTGLWPRMLPMSKKRTHSSSNTSSSINSSRNSLWDCLPKKANRATHHVSLSQPTITVVANLDNCSPTNPGNPVVEDVHQADCQHHVSQQTYSKADVILANA